MPESKRQASTPIRVVVTGLGLRTALGKDAETTWAALRAGVSAATRLDIGTDPCRPWYGFPIEPLRGNRLPLGEPETRQAIADARLIVDGRPTFDQDRAASVIGLSKGDLGRLARFHARLLRDGPGSLELPTSDSVGPQSYASGTGDPLCPIPSPAHPGDSGSPWLDGWPDSAARRAAWIGGFRGPVLAPVAACATGVVAVLRAAALIRSGVCDVALAGAVDASLEPLVLGAFDRMRVLARVEGDPAGAVRPWDRQRSGFLVGEGGAVLVLERDDHAEARGVPAYAEVLNGALGSDASHETNLDPNPARLSGLISEALSRSSLSSQDIDYINVHGTATRVNDPLECQAIRRALGGQADSVSCSANKGQIGHLLGGAGAAELAITCLAIRDQFVPPTVNLTNPDPACDLDATPLVGRQRTIRSALKLSIGFGGHLAVAALRRPEGLGRGEY